MSITLGVAIYFILWWLVLFAVLPWGVRSHREAGVEVADGADHGAPVMPRLVQKAIATTVVSGILYICGYAVWRTGWLSLDRLPMPFKDISL